MGWDACIELMKKFRETTDGLEACKKPEFVLGVYSELCQETSRGDYRKGVDGLNDREKQLFVTRVAGGLVNCGHVKDAKQLLTQYGLDGVSNRLNYTVSELAKLGVFPGGSEYPRFSINRDGVQLTIGDDYGGSIIYSEGSFGGEKGQFEILPYFGGKKLKDIGFRMEQTVDGKEIDLPQLEFFWGTVNYLSLGSALAIAKAAQSRDEAALRAVISTIKSQN